MALSSVSNRIPLSQGKVKPGYQNRAERTSGRRSGRPGAAVSGQAEGEEAIVDEAVASSDFPTTNWGGGGVGWGGGGAAPSSLDTWCQVSKNKDLSPEEVAKYRKNYKRALVEALRACGRHSEALLVTGCGEDFKVGKCLDCGAVPAFPVTCGHRLCPDCASRRGAILVSEHEDILKQLRYPKMLTLTFLSVAHLDKNYIRWARNCFRRLRRRKVLSRCWGGIYSFEVTHSVEYGWHLHIHALVGSGYIGQADLSSEWQKITGAVVVDIRAVQGKDKWGAVKEVVKYPAKAVTFLEEPALVNEFLLATERVNLAYGFGALYRVRSKRHSESKMRCPICGGTDIDFSGDMGFCVPKICVEKVAGGYIWRSPPSK